MSARSQTWFRWSSRILGCVVCLYLGLFALDATGTDLLIHLLPAAIVLTMVAVGWRWPSVGGVGFIGLAAAYALFAWQRPTWILAIAGPLAAVGALFLASRSRPARIAA